MQYSNIDTNSILFTDCNSVDKTTSKLFLYNTYIQLETNKNEAREEEETNTNQSEAQHNYRSIIESALGSS